MVRRCAAALGHDRATRRDRPRGWDRFVSGVRGALALPHQPLREIDKLARFDRLSIVERIDELELGAEEGDVLRAELESLAHAPLQDAGAVSVLRWDAISGYSLELTQYAGGRVTIVRGTGALLEAIAGAAPVQRRLEETVAAVLQRDDHVEVLTATRHGGGPGSHTARAVIVAAALNTLGAIEFTPRSPRTSSRRSRSARPPGGSS